MEQPGHEILNSTGGTSDWSLMLNLFPVTFGNRVFLVHVVVAVVQLLHAERPPAIRNATFEVLKLIFEALDLSHQSSGKQGYSLLPQDELQPNPATLLEEPPPTPPPPNYA